MKGIILKVISYTILIGVFALSLNMILGNRTITFVYKENINTLQTNFYIWKFDFWGYVKNIQLSATDVSVLIFKTPTREWQWMSNIFDGGALTNDLALMLDYVILVINITLYPIRVAAYLLRNVMALIGVNQDMSDPNNGLSWLIIFVRNILEKFAIPYL